MNQFESLVKGKMEAMARLSMFGEKKSKKKEKGDSDEEDDEEKPKGPSMAENLREL